MQKLTFRLEQAGKPKIKITSASTAVSYLREVWNADTLNYTESFYAIFLTRANHVIGYDVISEGGTTATIADGKVIFGKALTCGACALIIAHNHPSETCRPSETDLSFTKKLVEFGRFIELPILDHIILTEENGFYSMADEGKI